LLPKETLVQESQIRDILALSPAIAKDALNIEDKIDLLRKEYSLPSGRLDLLFISKDKLHLIELKVTPLKKESLCQVLRYRNDLETEKKEGKLANLKVIPYLVCPMGMLTNEIKELCVQNGVVPLELDLRKLLNRFYEESILSLEFIKVKPVSGINLAPFVLNPTLYYLKDHGPCTAKELVKAKTMYKNYYAHRKPEWLINEKYMVLGKALGLMERTSDGKISLTEIGEKYVEYDSTRPREMSDTQARFIREYILKNPFGSSINFGVYSLVEAVLELSKNVHPVPKKMVAEYFIKKVGKLYDWKKGASQQLYNYARFAEQLGLIGIIGKELYLTPTGINFVLQLQLHKALAMLR
jgi:hypothetical protein